jgi:hypothetical protein
LLPKNPTFGYARYRKNGKNGINLKRLEAGSKNTVPSVTSRHSLRPWLGVVKSCTTCRREPHSQPEVLTCKENKKHKKNKNEGGMTTQKELAKQEI